MPSHPIFIFLPNPLWPLTWSSPNQAKSLRIVVAHPISLSNVNLKISTKFVANRLNSHLPSLLHPDVGGLCPGRGGSQQYTKDPGHHTFCSISTDSTHDTVFVCWKGFWQNLMVLPLTNPVKAPNLFPKYWHSTNLQLLYQTKNEWLPSWSFLYL